VPRSAASERRKTSLALQGSLLLHAAAAAVWIAQPALWPWAVATVLADHLVLTAAGLWPRSSLLGPNLRRLPAAAGDCVAITIDDGPDPAITPKVLDLLDQHAAHATFFCIGQLVQTYPDLAREILRRGHCIENHSQRHLHRFSLLGPVGMSAEIAEAQRTIETITGQRPRFFRAPAGLRNPFLEPILARQGLQLASWTRRGFDTVNADADRVHERLTRNLAAGDILLLHDGHAARTASGIPVILAVLPGILETIAAARLRPITLRAATAGSHTADA
jgi:peptidoglycan/xylan/chitin deacetylase (PgdA/CDA1 family)